MIHVTSLMIIPKTPTGLATRQSPSEVRLRAGAPSDWQPREQHYSAKTSRLTGRCGNRVLDRAVTTTSRPWPISAGSYLAPFVLAGPAAVLADAFWIDAPRHRQRVPGPTHLVEQEPKCRTDSHFESSGPLSSPP